MHTGTADVNEAYGASYSSAAAPMGGRRASGLGRRHGVEGLLRFTESQTIATQRLVGLGVPPGVPSRVYAAAATGGLRLLRRLGRR